VPKIVRIDSSDTRPTIDGTEWKRNTKEDSSKPLRVHPLRTWHYYLAVMIAIALLLSIVTGTGAIIYKKSQNIVQRYIDRLYGLED
jgi:hypothetical protein